ncbi:cell surface glycoprotein MUC18 isoform X2 [Dendropsophus ebraccatus]|uniref:cell surface glycoprotein MUC18 isoform X2 n=1 Tax=Dendropsophus ebraccatus TaxID=150705 RepID=UPI0038321A7A
MDILILLSLCLLSWRGLLAEIQGQHGHLSKEVKVVLGHNATLPCEVHSHYNSATSTLQWLYEKNGNHLISTSGQKGTIIEDSDLKGRVSVSPNMQLVIDDLQVQDEKLFICRVTDQNGIARESNVHFRVYKAPGEPEIKMEDNGIPITNEAVQIGTCESKNGYPLFNITWYRNNTQLRNGKDGVLITSQVTVKSSGLITVRSVLSSPVEKSDIYSEFYCEVSYDLPKGHYMRESERNNIMVDYPNTEVRLYVRGKSEIIKEGDEVELKCVGNGNPQPEITLHRKDEDQALAEGSSYSWVVSRNDSGGYVCSAISLDVFHELEAGTELHVHFLDPPVLSKESSVNVELGSVLDVSCHANASAQTDIHWTREGNTIASGSDVSLNFQDYTDAGRYACVASVVGVPGLTKTKELEVIVRGKPQVSVSPHHVEVRLGDKVTVKCTAIGYPVPQITWYINDTEVDVVITNSNISDNEVMSELTFLATQDHLNEQLLCMAENELNTSMEYIQLHERSDVTEKPIPKTENESTRDPSVESRSQKSYGVIIVAVIICILLLAILGAVLYFLYKKGRIPCGRSGTKDITKPGEKDQIVVEMKPDSPAEESVLLPGPQDKKQPVDQEKYMDLRN